MIVKAFAIGAFLTNSYVVSCEQTRNALIIDPSFDDHAEAEKVFKYVNDNSLAVKSVVNTHGHPDHTCGNGLARDTFHAPILIHECDACFLGERGRSIAASYGFQHSSPPPDKILRDGDLIELGETSLKVIHTPGHSPGGITLLGKREIFVGDTLFAGSIGRTDFPESSESDMQLSLRKLATLPDDIVAYTGHGPKTTIGIEKANNPFLRWLLP